MGYLSLHHGARLLNRSLAAIGLNRLSLAVVSAAVPPGSPMPDFRITCDGATESCICNTVGACPGVTGYDRAAMNTIVFGRGSSSCTDATSFYDTGMCDIFPRIRPQNVVIVYTQTGLGYAGRPGKLYLAKTLVTFYQLKEDVNKVNQIEAILNARGQ